MRVFVVGASEALDQRLVPGLIAAAPYRVPRMTHENSR